MPGAEMWQLAISPLELIARGVITYIVFLAALRLSGKRELGQFTIFDLALVLLAANALQPAITGPDASIPGGIIIIVTLFVLNRLVAIGRSRSRLLRRVLDYPATPIARDGHWIEASIEKEELSEEDLDSALREHGLDSIHDVKIAVLEHDGTISVVPTEGEHLSLRSRRRRYRHRAGES
ncbi:MAG TPA: YetF domain-containing protein [Candidatus Limnocylindrales bacterium]|nr:YetF domain-containing protein [Candidatus Limnocylindrales bacterium]